MLRTAGSYPAFQPSYCCYPMKFVTLVWNLTVTTGWVEFRLMNREKTQTIILSLNGKVRNLIHRTSLKASRSSRKDLSCSQRLLIHLHTGNTTSEISPVSNPGSHSHWVISCKSNATNRARRNKSVSNKKPSNASAIIIRAAHIVPCTVTNCATGHCGCEAPASSTREACK